MSLKSKYQPKNIKRILKPMENLEKIWLVLSLILSKEEEAILKHDLGLLEELVNLENIHIKNIFDLSNIIETLEKDLKKQGYPIKPLFFLWRQKEENNKKNYLLKKEKIIHDINKKKEKILEQSQSLKEGSPSKIRQYHQNFPLPKVLNIQI